jgi:hypothetical protein
MSARTKRRAGERTQLAAAMCRVPLSDWVAMTRRERRRRLWAVRWEATRG